MLPLAGRLDSLSLNISSFAGSIKVWIHWICERLEAWAESNAAGSLLISRSCNRPLASSLSMAVSIFVVPQGCSIRIEGLLTLHLTEAAEEPAVRDLEGESDIEDTESRAFSSCHMTSTGRFGASLASVSKENK
jgi:hypothetical protein